MLTVCPTSVHSASTDPKLYFMLYFREARHRIQTPEGRRLKWLRATSTFLRAGLPGGWSSIPGEPDPSEKFTVAAADPTETPLQTSTLQPGLCKPSLSPHLRHFFVQNGLQKNHRCLRSLICYYIDFSSSQNWGILNMFTQVPLFFFFKLAWMCWWSFKDCTFRWDPVTS